MGNQTVKDLSVLLVLVKTVTQKSAQVTATLRIPKRYGLFDITRSN
jgi:hypothetical protein